MSSQAIRRIAFFVAGGLFATGLIPAVVSGYILEGPRWSSGSNVVFRLGLGNATHTLSDGNISWNNAAAPALTAWNEQIQNIQLTGVNSAASAASGDNVNSVIFSTTVFGDAFGSDTLAVTEYHFSGSRMVEADVLFNKARTFDSYRGPLKFSSTGFAIADIQRVFLHELGHAIGLDHTGGDAIMNPTINNRYVLAPDDISGAQALYGQPAPISNVNLSQVLLFNSLTRESRIWFFNDTLFNIQISGPLIPPGYVPVETGDFNADGKTDMVLFNVSTGQIAIWYLNGGDYLGGKFTGALAAGWSIAAANDYNGDGELDYVLVNSSTRQTAIWYLNRGAYLGGNYGPSLPAGWTLAGTGDFNGDGKSDYLLYNGGTRQTAIWHLNKNVFLSSVYGPGLPSGWIVAGVADFNRNGRPDLLLYNGSTRQTAIWHLSGNVFAGGAYGPTLPSGFAIVAPK